MNFKQIATLSISVAESYRRGWQIAVGKIENSGSDTLRSGTDTFTEKDLVWLNEYGVPKEIEYGLKYLANIVSDDTQFVTESWQGIFST
ncbi:hypothetical protein LVD17_22955 [Fulvivirga ulvae]|uniref:hypothetical protein n=1 Tax=Fulvivirga ulvae TaxID=2904245 RepID=UPI001F231CED|nr:hypothetical protein [Fulvivirga ulvae]UII31155.1 hypothetical protein LVD17_22955 [Fulvivirga ulvae]